MLTCENKVIAAPTLILKVYILLYVVSLLIYTFFISNSSLILILPTLYQNIIWQHLFFSSYQNFLRQLWYLKLSPYHIPKHFIAALLLNFSYPLTWAVYIPELFMTALLLNLSHSLTWAFSFFVPFQFLDSYLGGSGSCTLSC